MPGNKTLLLTTFSDLSKLLYQFLLSDSAYVCLSWALPQTFGRVGGQRVASPIGSEESFPEVA
jgi:hypothetical protein